MEPLLLKGQGIPLLPHLIQLSQLSQLTAAIVNAVINWSTTASPAVTTNGFAAVRERPYELLPLRLGESTLSSVDTVGAGNIQRSWHSDAAVWALWVGAKPFWG